LTGEAVSGDWLVDEIRLVVSFLSPEGPRYEPVTLIRMG
jgi:2'-5' RNA ligase